MNFDGVTGVIEHRLELPATGETVRALRATLMTLGQRLPAGQAEDLAASLPMEIKWYLTGAVDEHGQRFDWREFIRRVSDIEQTDPAAAAYHARVIIDLIQSLVPESDFQQFRNALPDSESDENWGNLFQLVDAGGWSHVHETRPGEIAQGIAIPKEIDESKTTNLPSRATFHIYVDRAGEWRWRLVHDNGNIIADSGEGYVSRQSCLNGIESVKQNARGAPVERVEPASESHQ